MERGDEFSNFRSAIEWPVTSADFVESAWRADSQSSAIGTSCKKPKENWIPLGAAATAAIESAAIAVEIAHFCESPIEIDLAVRLTKAIRIIDDPTLSLKHQFKLGRYRYDLFIEREGRSKPLVLIECDGKEFHSTDEQVTNDRAKDALAAKEGIPLLRFSGSEIFRDLKACVFLVLKGLRFRAHLTQRDWDALEFGQMV